METQTTKRPEKFLFFFSKEQTDGDASMGNLLGGKGANLAEMSKLGVSVPPGFTISTEICGFFNQENQLPDFVKEEVLKGLEKIEANLGKKFGDADSPLLVSVRSGARVSMPGMMDTILNLGLNDTTVEGLVKASDNPRFAWDSYRRFVQMYSNVVMGMNYSLLEVLLEDLKVDKNITDDSELEVEDLKILVNKFKEEIYDSTQKVFPEDPLEQLWGAISAVFESWNSDRAITYRKLHEIPEEWGTAVNVQSMVFGNMGEDSATGVAFTRNPSTGEKKFYGEFLVNAQGEDVVAGIRTPQPISQIPNSELKSLEELMPKAYAELVDIYQKLEAHYRDMQDIEFTIEKNKLWMLQTRTGKRTARSAINIACDMMDEQLINEEEAVLRVDPMSLDQLLHPSLDPKAEKNILTKGLPASPGAVTGKIVFTSEEAEEEKKKGEKVILVRVETSPEDIAGMVAAEGILTTRGGMTSHAAVVARGIGKCCVAGCGEADVDYVREELRINNFLLKKFDEITLDGGTGEVFLGSVTTIPPQLDDNFHRFMALADKYREMDVRTNADTPKDSQVAREFGAQGIGLCRTEHMFFGPERIDAVREMIIAENLGERQTALDKLLPMQREDFYQLFKVMEGLPVTIRLLDPPLHEFVPQTDEEMEELAKRLRISFEKLRAKIRGLHEFNPMLGHRGCRLAVSYPEMYVMQARAIAEAAVKCVQDGQELTPEIMIPLVSTKKELAILRERVDGEVKRVQAENSMQFQYLIGTMIELPRAAVTADEIAEEADFFSFGTNDLTQTGIGLSRDDAGKFLGTYVNSGIFEKDPFVSIDQKGVGKLVQMGTTLGRSTKPALKVGVCGEHGGDPSSIEFFQKTGLDYVSCSPFRVPIARLAAAQAAIRQKTLSN